MNAKTIQSISLDAKLLYERLSKVSIGETVEYGEMSKLIGRDVQGVARCLMETARRKALHDDRMVFGVLMNVGLKRLTDVEIVATGENTVTRIRRMSSRSLKVITAVQDFNGMPNEAKIRHNAYASVLGAIGHATRSNSIKRIEARVAESQAALPLARTLEAFKG